MSRQSDIKKGLIEITKSRPMAYQLLRFLVDNNCKIKVDRELPYSHYANMLFESNKKSTIRANLAMNTIYEEAQRDMIKAGYVATEPLIEN